MALYILRDGSITCCDPSGEPWEPSSPEALAQVPGREDCDACGKDLMVTAFQAWREYKWVTAK